MSVIDVIAVMKVTGPSASESFHRPSIPPDQGIPLTDARVGNSFAVVSGHDVEGTDWSAFSSIPTLVILMAGRRVGRVGGECLDGIDLTSHIEYRTCLRFAYLCHMLYRILYSSAHK